MQSVSAKRQIRVKPDGLSRLKFQFIVLAGIQRRAVFDNAEFSVKLVGQERVADLREVDSDLVLPSGQRPGLHERVSVESLKDAEFCQSRTRIKCVRLAAHQRAAVIGNLTDRQFDPSLVRINDSMHDRQIRLGNSSLLELLSQSPVRVELLRNNHGTAGLPVDAMDDSWPEQSGKRGLPVEVMLQSVDQRVRQKFPAGMGDLSRWFTEADEPRIFVQNLHGKRFGNRRPVRRGNQPDSHGVIVSDAISERHRFVVDRDAARPDQSLHGKGRVVPKVFLQKRIDPPPAQDKITNEFAPRRAAIR